MEEGRQSLLGFTSYTWPKYRVNWHHVAICEFLDAWLRREFRFGIIETAPRHGKSELMSRRLPARILGHNPDASIIATSYGASLARKMNRDVQRVIDSRAYERLYPGTKLFGKNIRTLAHGSWLRNSEQFEVVNHRGSYLCAGIGGPITGSGGDWALIDDPIKDDEEAGSQVIRDKHWDWYTGTLLTRLESGGAVMMSMTRWSEDDLAGRAIASGKRDAGAHQYRVLRLPALAEPWDTPDRHLLDRREPGEALWPWKKDKEELLSIQATQGSYKFNAMFQQRPSAITGNIIKGVWLEHRFNAAPLSFLRIVQSWDAAGKKTEKGSYYACVTIGETARGKYILDVWRERASYPEVKRKVRDLATKWRPNAVLIENKAAGQSLIEDFTVGSGDGGQRLNIIPIEPHGDKIVRLAHESGAFESGGVWLPESAPWVSDYVDELTKFPGVVHNDQVDATSQGLMWLRTTTFTGGFPEAVGSGSGWS